MHLHDHVSEGLLDAPVGEAWEKFVGLGNVDVHRERELLAGLSFRKVGDRRRDAVGDIHYAPTTLATTMRDRNSEGLTKFLDV